MKARNFVFALMLVALLGLAVSLGSAAAQTSPDNTQTSELYKLQAAFHRFATVHDPVNGDSPEVITQRIRDMLSLWTANGVLYVHGFGAIDGYYIGNGDPQDSSSCPEPSGTAGKLRGSLCTYFKWVAGPFQPANKFVSLTPTYKTSFDVSGDTAAGYWECHYYDVSTAPWTAKAKVAANASFQKVNGHWLLSSVDAPPVGIPVP